MIVEETKPKREVCYNVGANSIQSLCDEQQNTKRSKLNQDYLSIAGNANNVASQLGIRNAIFAQSCPSKAIPKAIQSAIIKLLAPPQFIISLHYVPIWPLHLLFPYSDRSEALNLLSQVLMLTRC
jgi:hypothetical protein